MGPEIIEITSAINQNSILPATMKMSTCVNLTSEQNNTISAILAEINGCLQEF
jgi:hypothetical protein